MIHKIGHKPSKKFVSPLLGQIISLPMAATCLGSALAPFHDIMIHTHIFQFLFWLAAPCQILNSNLVFLSYTLLTENENAENTKRMQI
jgi:hypothetical protein